MRIEIYERAQTLANYIIENKTTVRKTAKAFNMSKSTVYKDVTERLKSVHSPLALEVGDVLQKNKEERHIRGGEATRQKYLKMQKNR